MIVALRKRVCLRLAVAQLVPQTALHRIALELHAAQSLLVLEPHAPELLLVLGLEPRHLCPVPIAAADRVLQVAVELAHAALERVNREVLVGQAGLEPRRAAALATELVVAVFELASQSVYVARQPVYIALYETRRVAPLVRTLVRGLTLGPDSC